MKKIPSEHMYGILKREKFCKNLKVQNVFNLPDSYAGPVLISNPSYRDKRKLRQFESIVCVIATLKTPLQLEQKCDPLGFVMLNPCDTKRKSRQLQHQHIILGVSETMHIANHMLA